MARCSTCGNMQDYPGDCERCRLAAKDAEIGRLRAESEAARKCHAVYEQGVGETIARLTRERDDARAEAADHASHERLRIQECERIQADMAAVEEARNTYLEELTFLAAMVSKTRAAQPIDGHRPNLRAAIAGMLLDLDGYQSALNMAIADRNRVERRWYEAHTALADRDARLGRVAEAAERARGPRKFFGLVETTLEADVNAALDGWEAP